MAVINQPLATLPQAAEVQKAINDYIAELQPQLRQLNLFVSHIQEMRPEQGVPSLPWGLAADDEARATRSTRTPSLPTRSTKLTTPSATSLRGRVSQ